MADRCELLWDGAAVTITEACCFLILGGCMGWEDCFEGSCRIVFVFLDLVCFLLPVERPLEPAVCILF